ncbi:MAG: L-threonylcarbamoyladenylate synthase [Patescibacteria group bacterium]|nr:L-threonylcarbamoyladenylate synthase [Patescibacteria group bacterium]MDD5490688.1 L-threonylcarbamoyladenylate synthase [Patescibacteria group bacterium]
MIIKKITKKSIEEAVAVLRRGGAIVYPTDTLYGLGADIFNKKAVEKVYKIKGRNFKKPLLISVGSKKDISRWAYLTETARRVAEHFLPGAITLVLKKRKIVPEWVSGGRKKVGIRMPDDKTALTLARLLKRPLTSTSANISGKITPDTAAGVYKIFKKRKFKPDLILDGGKLKGKRPSTIIDFTGKKIKVLRAGESLKKIKDFFNI